MSNDSVYSRRGFLKGLTAVAGGASLGVSTASRSGSWTAPGPQVEQPNIVLIMSDNQGRNLGCYGRSDIHTPNIDRLASQGVRCADVSAGGVVCCPTRSALLTGRYPERNGVFDNIINYIVHRYGHRFKELEYTLSSEMSQGLDLRETTIGEALQLGGYRTGIVGKWDSGRARRYLPLQRGFDSFYGFACTGIDYWSHERYGIPSLFRGNQRIQEDGYATNLFARESVRFIEESADQPFFLFASFNAPGNTATLDGPSYQVPDEYVKRYDELPGSTPARFKAAITCLDDGVGDILEALDREDLADDTLVIFASDGGGPERTGLRGGHGHLYEGALRVPLVARWPGEIPPGVTSDAFFTLTDLFPTFLEVAGVEPPSDLMIDGVNVLDVLRDQEPCPRSTYFWQRRGKRAMRDGPWKWVRHTGSRYGFPDELPEPDAKGELYDLDADVREQNNLAEAHPDRERRMRQQWQDWMYEMAQAPDRGPFPKVYFDLLGFGDGSYRL